MAQLTEKDCCIECGGKLIDSGTDMVCSNCGLVNNRVYQDPAYQAVETAKSYGNVYTSVGNVTVDGERLGTCIGNYGHWNLVDHNGTNLESATQEKFQRIKRIQDYYAASQDNDRTYRATRLLNSVCGAIELPDKVRVSAFWIYSQIAEDKISRIRMIDMVAGSIYLAVRIQSYNLRIKELLTAIESLGYKIEGRQLLAAAAAIKSKTKVRVRNATAEDYLERIIKNLVNDHDVQAIVCEKGLNIMEYEKELRRLSKELLDQISADDRGGRDPYALACACVVGADVVIGRMRQRRRGYLTQRDVAKINEVAEFTLREHYITIVKPCIDA